MREVDGWSDEGPFYFLELWHGPTLAFKDMALQCMPLFFSEALETAHAEGRQETDKLILVATSGDTGVAALNGFADRPHVKIIVCYPSGGVSAVQQAQMTTQAGDNLTVLAVEGDFDACQRSVKAVFADQAFAAELAGTYGLSLSSANSINWGRLLPQIVYYFSAYADMVKREALQMGDPLDICVPSGNFGDILGAYYAKLMGLPAGRLICASNTNNILTDFFSTGVYDISDRSLVKTASPSMDILISSNLERLLFEVHRDGAQVRAWMKDLAEKRVFRVDEETLDILRRDFAGDWVDTETCLQGHRSGVGGGRLPHGPAHRGGLGSGPPPQGRRPHADRLDGPLEQVPGRRHARTARPLAGHAAARGRVRAGGGPRRAGPGERRRRVGAEHPGTAGALP